MKKILSHLLSFSLLVSVLTGTSLYAQSLIFKIPFTYTINAPVVPQSKVKTKIMNHMVYSPWVIIKSLVDTRSNGFSGFPAGSCTEYIARQRPELFVNPDGSRRMTGNAEDRLRNAQRIWFATWQDPKLWSIAVYYEGKWARKYGHVAYVERIQKDGTLIVSEMNYNQEYIVTWRVVKANLAAGYIY